MAQTDHHNLVMK